MVDLYSFKQKGDTTAGWAGSTVPILPRQMAVEYPTSGSPKIKIGSISSTDLFSQLPYAVDQVFTASEKSTLSKIVTPQQYGATGGGSADDIVAIQNAVNALSVGTGGLLWFPPGVYKISSAIEISSPGITIEGSGPNCTTIMCSNATQHGIAVNAGIQNTCIRNLGFNSSVTKTNGAAIKTFAAFNVNIENILVTNHCKGFHITDSLIVWLQRVQIQLPAPANGYGIYIDGTSFSADHYIRDVQMNGNNVAAYGMYISHSGGTWVDSCDFIYCNNGLGLAPVSGQNVDNLFFSRNAWDTSIGPGIVIAPASGAAVRRCTFMGEWTASNGTHGITANAAGVIDDIQFIGHRSINNVGHGVAIVGATNLCFSGGLFGGNSRLASNSNDGMWFSGTNGLRIIDNHCGFTHGLTNNQRYGISINTGTTRYMITANETASNLTGGVFDVGTAPKSVIGNL